jgi:hypothetical protein
MGTRKKWLILLAGAWVLWSRSLILGAGSSFNGWEVVDAFPSYERCEDRAKALDRRVNREKEKSTASFVCLPDTIDPRAPKTTKDKN